jgi:preprotein translocase subunit SecF
VVAALYFLGSEAIKDFALAMLVGVITGTYSTIYIASSILVWWHNKKPVTK